MDCNDKFLHFDFLEALKFNYFWKLYAKLENSY